MHFKLDWWGRWLFFLNFDDDFFGLPEISLNFHLDILVNIYGQKLTRPQKTRHRHYSLRFSIKDFQRLTTLLITDQRYILNFGIAHDRILSLIDDCLMFNQLFIKLL